jgi:hypothetical protein
MRGKPRFDQGIGPKSPGFGSSLLQFIGLTLIRELTAEMVAGSPYTGINH